MGYLQAREDQKAVNMRAKHDDSFYELKALGGKVIAVARVGSSGAVIDLRSTAVDRLRSMFVLVYHIAGESHH